MEELLTAYRRVCEVCSADEGRYKCPRCSLFTCSLACCLRHKAERGCDGKRDKTAFVDINEYSEDNLRSDFHFLEDVLQSKNRKLGGDLHRGSASDTRRRKRHKPEVSAITPRQDLDGHLPSTRRIVKEVRWLFVPSPLVHMGRPWRGESTSWSCPREWPGGRATRLVGITRRSAWSGGFTSSFSLDRSRA